MILAILSIYVACGLLLTAFLEWQVPSIDPDTGESYFKMRLFVCLTMWPLLVVGMFLPPPPEE